MAPPRPSSSVLWILGLLLLGGIVAIVLPGYLASRRASNERHASAALKALASAEADFRGNDRDVNNIQDFWTADVAGLYDVIPRSGGGEIRLIERGIAEADPSRPGSRPYHGYWFLAMDVDESGQPYREDTKGSGSTGRKSHNYSKFAFCAYPAGRFSGRSMYWINEGNTIFKEPFTGEPRRRWPTDEELQGSSDKGVD